MVYTLHQEITYLQMLNHIMCQKRKNLNFANSVDPDEVAQNEPHHNLRCLPSGEFVNSVDQDKVAQNESHLIPIGTVCSLV